MLECSPGVEICGIITSDLAIHPIRNVARNPRNNFVFSKREYFTALKEISAQELTILCIYHTHPSGTAEPSQADIDFIRHSQRDALIVSRNDHRWVPYATINK